MKFSTDLKFIEMFFNSRLINEHIIENNNNFIFYRIDNEIIKYFKRRIIKLKLNQKEKQEKFEKEYNLKLHEDAEIEITEEELKETFLGYKITNKDMRSHFGGEDFIHKQYKMRIIDEELVQTRSGIHSSLEKEGALLYRRDIEDRLFEILNVGEKILYRDNIIPEITTKKYSLLDEIEITRELEKKFSDKKIYIGE